VPKKIRAIVVYTRDGTSGTRDGFTSAIGFSEAKSDDSKLAPGYVEVASNGDMITAVKKDVNGIGYISLSTLSGSGVSALSYEGVAPERSQRFEWNLQDDPKLQLSGSGGV
jgi:phosphate transport system substrate-binding protein